MTPSDRDEPTQLDTGDVCDRQPVLQPHPVVMPPRRTFHQLQRDLQRLMPETGPVLQGGRIRSREEDR